MPGVFVEGELNGTFTQFGVTNTSVMVDRDRARYFKDNGWEVRDILVRYEIAEDGSGDFDSEDVLVWMTESSSS